MSAGPACTAETNLEAQEKSLQGSSVLEPSPAVKPERCDPDNEDNKSLCVSVRERTVHRWNAPFGDNIPFIAEVERVTQVDRWNRGTKTEVTNGLKHPYVRPGVASYPSVLGLLAMDVEDDLVYTTTVLKLSVTGEAEAQRIPPIRLYVNVMQAGYQFTDTGNQTRAASAALQDLTPIVGSGYFDVTDGSEEGQTIEFTSWKRTQLADALDRVRYLWVNVRATEDSFTWHVELPMFLTRFNEFSFDCDPMHVNGDSNLHVYSRLNTVTRVNIRCSQPQLIVHGFERYDSLESLSLQPSLLEPGLMFETKTPYFSCEDGSTPCQPLEVEFLTLSRLPKTWSQQSPGRYLKPNYSLALMSDSVEEVQRDLPDFIELLARTEADHFFGELKLLTMILHPPESSAAYKEFSAQQELQELGERFREIARTQGSRLATGFNLEIYSRLPTESKPQKLYPTM